MIREKNRILDSFRIPFQIHLAPRGNCWHRDESCGHLRNASSTRVLHGCELSGTQPEVPLPQKSNKELK